MEEAQHHVVSPVIYMVIFGSLLVLTGAHGVGVVSLKWESSIPLWRWPLPA
jgi:hypothetical protein